MYYMFVICILLTAELFWLDKLVKHLANDTLDPTDKICWTVVLCSLNLLGLFMFLMAGPKPSKSEVIE
jgi:hypothetical protein